MGISRREMLLGLAATSVSGCAGPRMANNSGPYAREDKIVARFAAEHGFAGVILVGDQDGKPYQWAFGPAEIESETKATPSTRYALGSISKFFTSVAALKLVDANQLALDEPIQRYLDTLDPAVGTHVTLRALLSNSSGVPDFADTFWKDERLRESTASAASVVEQYVAGPLRFQPGTRFDYAAINWVIICAILEKVAQRDFEHVLLDLVFNPLGMTESGVATDGFEGISKMAVGYVSLQPPVRRMRRIPGFLAATGTIYSTARDQFKAAPGIFEGSFLSRAMRRELTKVTTAQEAYALGIRVNRVESDGATMQLAWASGMTDGVYCALLAHDLDRHRTVVALNNTAIGLDVLSQVVIELASASTSPVSQ